MPFGRQQMRSAQDEMNGLAGGRLRSLDDDLDGCVACLRTAGINQTVRSVIVIDPTKKIRLILNYPMETGRNFAEILRAIDALQLAERHEVTTLANWKAGEDVIIASHLSDEEARKRLLSGWKAAKPYIRVAPQPR
jgi:hypothetical protein